MSATDRERVISGIVAGLEAMGGVKRVERSNWNSNPKRSERLRRTRVENAENVASSRSSLGILGKKSPKPSACWRFWRMVHPSILAPGRKSYRDAPVLSRGISFNRLDGSDRLLLAQSGDCVVTIARGFLTEGVRLPRTAVYDRIIRRLAENAHSSVARCRCHDKTRRRQSLSCAAAV